MDWGDSDTYSSCNFNGGDDPYHRWIGKIWIHLAAQKNCKCAASVVYCGFLDNLGVDVEANYYYNLMIYHAYSSGPGKDEN